MNCSDRTRGFVRLAAFAGLSSLLHLQQLLAFLLQVQKLCRSPTPSFRKSEDLTLSLPTFGMLSVLFSHTKPFFCSYASSSVHSSASIVLRPVLPVQEGFLPLSPYYSYHHSSHRSVPNHYQGATTTFFPPASIPELCPFLPFPPVPGKQLGSGSLGLLPLLRLLFGLGGVFVSLLLPHQVLQLPSR